MLTVERSAPISVKKEETTLVDIRAKAGYLFLKRSIDILLVLLALPILFPVMLLVTLAIRRDSSGPIFFIQERVGKDNKRFKIIKFRTMYCDIDREAHREYMQKFVNGQTEESDKHFKPFQENQVTKVGRILRKTSLDELPQFINILKGEMSLVGPRPNVLWEVEAYEEWHRERLKVLPGITGLAQISGRSGIPFDEIVTYDLKYIDNLSFRTDFKILFLTIFSVFVGAGAK